MMASPRKGTRPALRDRGGRFLPSRQALQRRGVSSLVKTLERWGIRPDVAALRAAARRATERIVGADRPDMALTRQQQAQVMAAMRRELLREAKDYVRRLEMEAHGLRGKDTGSKHAVWQAVGDNRTCDSCGIRHGEEHTMREWEVMGLPGSGNLVCGSNCRCELVPMEWVQEKAA